jgi:hypothetical protein
VRLGCLEFRIAPTFAGPEQDSGDEFNGNFETACGLGRQWRFRIVEELATIDCVGSKIQRRATFLRVRNSDGGDAGGI